RVQAHPAGPRLPIGAARLVPQAAVELPRPAAVVAPEKSRWGHSGPHDVDLLSRDDDPDPIDRRTRVPGESGALGLVPLPHGVVRVIEPRTVLSVRHRRQVRTRSRITHGVFDGDAAELSCDLLHGSAAGPPQDEQALAGAYQE